MSDDPDVAAIRRWQRDHWHTEFVFLYEAFKNIIEKAIHRYPVEIHSQLTIPALGIFVQALSNYNERRGITPATHVATQLQRLSRVAGKILYPDLPESAWPRTMTPQP